MNSFSNCVNNVRKKNRKEPQEQNYKLKTCWFVKLVNIHFLVNSADQEDCGNWYDENCVLPMF